MTNIRIWTIGKLDGDPNTWIIPTKQMVEILKEKISAAESGITKDIIWGPDLKCQVLTEEGLSKILIPVQLDSGEILYKMNDIEKL